MMKKFHLPRLHWFFYFLIVVIFLTWLYLLLAYGLAMVLPEKKVSNGMVSGILVRKQIWSGEIRITGDVWTTPGTVVTVMPGTVIKIDAKGDRFNLDFLPWHLKSGINIGEEYHDVRPGEPFWDEKEKIQVHFATLYAIGTKEQPITFDSNAQFPSPYDVNVISATHGVIASAVMAHYRRLEIGNNFSIRDSVLREVGECSVCIHRGKAAIINNVFEQALRESIWIDGGSPRIADNKFLNLNGRGIVIDPKRLGSPSIVNNVFEMPSREALVLLTGLEEKGGDVTLNRFSGNSIIEIACDSQVHFSQNSIFSVISFIGNGCGGHYTFGPNYWGTQDVRTIMQERITNKDREFTVEIPTILTVPPMGVGRRE